MKGEIFNNWSIEEDMYLFPIEVKKLRRTTKQGKQRAMQRGNKVAVRDWFLVELSLATGLRVSEMAALRCEDMLIGRNGYQHVFVRCGKGGKARLVLVNREFASNWQEYRQWKAKNGESTAPQAPVLLSSHKKTHMSPRALLKAFKRSLHRAKLGDYPIHACRHTYATSLLRKCKPGQIRFAQRQLGHSSVRVTEVYWHVLQQDAHRLVEGLYS